MEESKANDQPRELPTNQFNFTEQFMNVFIIPTLTRLVEAVD